MNLNFSLKSSLLFTTNRSPFLSIKIDEIEDEGLRKHIEIMHSNSAIYVSNISDNHSIEKDPSNDFLIDEYESLLERNNKETMLINSIEEDEKTRVFINGEIIKLATIYLISIARPTPTPKL